MKNIIYTSPFVPAEWIIAHGLKPDRIVVGQPTLDRSCATEGMCPYAQSFVDTVSRDESQSAVVLTTTCDQMRRAADLFALRCRVPVFVMNVPFTWKTPGSFRLYISELHRLGRFLVKIGGRTKSEKNLMDVMCRYDNLRQKLRSTRGNMTSRHFNEAVTNIGSLVDIPDLSDMNDSGSIPLAIIGGPLPSSDYWLLDSIEEYGGRVAVDGTENGERGMPGPFDRNRLDQDPVQELANAYFLTIPDVFQRPNDRLYQWLKREIAESQVKGIIVRHYIWCDLWRAEVHRITEWAEIPVLHIDVDISAASRQRTLTRIQAFLEVFQ